MCFLAEREATTPPSLNTGKEHKTWRNCLLVLLLGPAAILTVEGSPSRASLGVNPMGELLPAHLEPDRHGLAQSMSVSP